MVCNNSELTSVQDSCWLSYHVWDVYVTVHQIPFSPGDALHKCFEDVSVSSRVHDVKYDYGPEVDNLKKPKDCAIAVILVAWIESDTNRK